MERLFLKAPCSEARPAEAGGSAAEDDCRMETANPSLDGPPSVCVAADLDLDDGICKHGENLMPFELPTLAVRFYEIDNAEGTREN